MKTTITKLICDGCGLPISVNCNERITLTKKKPFIYIRGIYITEESIDREADLCANCRKEFYTQASWYISLADPLNNVERTK